MTQSEIIPEKFFKGSGVPDSRVVEKDYYDNDLLPGLPIFFSEEVDKNE